MLGWVVDEAPDGSCYGSSTLSRCVARLGQVMARGSARSGRCSPSEAPFPNVGRTAGELAVFEALRRAGLPLPVPQHRVVLDDRVRRFDYASPDHKVAVEFDGVAEHGLLRSTFDDDGVRGNALAVQLWSILPQPLRRPAPRGPR